MKIEGLIVREQANTALPNIVLQRYFQRPIRRPLSHVQLDRLGIFPTENLYTEVHNSPEELRVINCVNMEVFLLGLNLCIQSKLQGLITLFTCHQSSLARQCR